MNNQAGCSGMCFGKGLSGGKQRQNRKEGGMACRKLAVIRAVIVPEHSGL